MDIRLDGNRALVTGAGKGIGREIAALLTRCGADVIAVSRTKQDLDSLEKEIGCRTIVADLADARQAVRAAEQAVQGGPVHCLVNNAGISVPQPLLETSVEAFDRTMAVNVR